jgi:hypothetical protein
MRSQAVAVNLNWRSPPAANLVQLVEKSKCTIVFAAHHFEEVAQVLAACVRVVYIIEDMELHKPVTSDRSRKPTIPCQPTYNAVIFFTSGSTSLPKAVPHTRASLMWLQHQHYAASPAPHETTDPNAGTLCFFPYFHMSSRRMPMCTHHTPPQPPTHYLINTPTHPPRPSSSAPPHPPLFIRLSLSSAPPHPLLFRAVMGYSANMLFNLYTGIRHLLHADAANAALTPPLLINACLDLPPAVINTTPWVVEGSVDALEKGIAPLWLAYKVDTLLIDWVGC